MQKADVFAVIMAGGVGERFWPMSKESNPKQFLKVFTGEPMIVTTAKRVSGYIPYSNIVVVTNEKYKKRTKLLFKGNNDIKVIGEPVGKNTAPAIAAAAAQIERMNPNGIMAVFSADHIIKPVSEFINSIKLAVKMAEGEGSLVCLGVKPTHPHTGLGYIESGKERASLRKIKGYSVKRFVEKPALKDAKKFLKSGKYLWNCGIFIWSAKTILNSFKEHMPALYKQLESARKAKSEKAFILALNKFYKVVEKESIDYGVLEHSKDISVVETTISWNDVGSWSAYEELFKPNPKGNIFKGNVVDIDSKDSLVISDDGLIATYGLSNTAVIKSGDSLLVINKDKMGDIKKLIANIRKDNEKFLQ